MGIRQCSLRGPLTKTGPIPVPSSSKTQPSEDVGNRELLVKSPWRSGVTGWREQSNPSWCDHCNFHIKPGGPFFLNWFNFHSSYRPGAKNTKPDALSRIYYCDLRLTDLDYILPWACVLGAIRWEVEKGVLQAQGPDAVLDRCPLNRVFVPADLKSAVLQSAHALPLSCHPRARRTLARV